MQQHICDLANNGNFGLQATLANQYYMYVFDITMVKMDGLTLRQILSENYYNYTPMLFLTARHTLDDKQAGLAVGADDYLVKPFELSESFK